MCTVHTHIARGYQGVGALRSPVARLGPRERMESCGLEMSIWPLAGLCLEQRCANDAGIDGQGRYCGIPVEEAGCMGWHLAVRSEGPYMRVAAV